MYIQAFRFSDINFIRALKETVTTTFKNGIEVDSTDRIAD